jgi:beta-glucosidase
VTDLEGLVAQLSLDEKAALMAGKDGRFTTDAPHIGLHAIGCYDGPSGVTARSGPGDYPYLTPCPTALGASWDVDLVRRVGEVIGDDAVQRDVQLIQAPNVNLARSPLGGRGFEHFSEDPWLTGVLGSAWMQGVQSRGVGCSVKHLTCNDSETERQTMNAIVNERVLREVYLLPFELAVKACAWSIMTAYNRVNGTFCAENGHLISDIVKGEWRFDGVFESDFHGTHSTAPSARAGLTLEMPGPAHYYGEALAAAVRAGEVDEAALDEAVLRLLRLAVRTGRLGDAKVTVPEPHAGPRDILREAAAAGCVLLTNRRGLLPLDPATAGRIAIIGPNAAQPTFQGASFAQVGQRQDLTTPLDALRDVFADTIYEPGATPAFRVPPLRRLRLATADDDTVPGMNVDYYIEDATEPAVREVRTAGNMIWNLRMPGVGPITRHGRVRIATTLLPDESGTYTFYMGSSAAFNLRIDGASLLEQGPQAPKDDTAVAIRPDILTATHHLEAGVPVAIEVEMTFGLSRAHSLHFGVQPPVPPDLLQRAEQAARRSQAVVLVVGETQDTAVESADRTTTRLPESQVELIERVCAANASTIVVVNAAHAVDMPWADRAGAVLQVWFPGQEFGPALADVITGRAEPGGRLPVTFAADEGDYPVFGLQPVNHDLVYESSPSIGYRHFDAEGIAPRFAFGHGLSYAEFSYGDFRVSTNGDRVSVEVTVRNESSRRGKEVVQVYVRAPSDEGKAPAELKGFVALHLQPHEQQTARVELDGKAFRHWGDDGWRIVPGEYELLVGRSAADIRLRGTVTR